MLDFYSQPVPTPIKMEGPIHEVMIGELTITIGLDGDRWWWSIDAESGTYPFGYDFPVADSGPTGYLTQAAAVWEAWKLARRIFTRERVYDEEYELFLAACGLSNRRWR